MILKPRRALDGAVPLRRCLGPPSVAYEQALVAGRTKRSPHEGGNLLRQVIAATKRIEMRPKRPRRVERLSRDFNTIRDARGSAERYEEAQLADTLEQGRGVEQFRILASRCPPTAFLSNRMAAKWIGRSLASLRSHRRRRAARTTFHTVEICGATRISPSSPPCVGYPHRVTKRCAG